MKVDKENAGVCYNDEQHAYFTKNNEDDRYTSVTTLIHKYTQEFDEEFWSGYKALQELLADNFIPVKKFLLTKKSIDQNFLAKLPISLEDYDAKRQEIKDEWKRKNQEACERGTAIHLEKEMGFYDNSRYEFLKLSGDYTCVKDHFDLSEDRAIYPEYLVSYKFDDTLKIAGQIDILVKEGNEIVIGDWKGLPLDTDIPTIDGFKKMKDLQVGDLVFDRDGNAVEVRHKSSVHHKPCARITFDNGDTIISDLEHRWAVHFLKNKKMHEKVMTTEELMNYMDSTPRRSDTIPKVLNPKPLNLPYKTLPIDPYVLGAWLGDGSKACGMLTQHINSSVWKEIERRGYKLGDNCVHDPSRANVRMSTVFGLRTELSKLGLLNGKHIPDMYLRASEQQRLDLLRGLMDTDGFYHKKRKRFVMETSQEWQKDAIISILGTFGIKCTTQHVKKNYKGVNNSQEFYAWQVNFSTSMFNPFLTRNQDIDLNAQKSDARTFRNIDKIEEVEMVPTQCIEVDSPSHTYLFGKECIVTHNTNRELKFKSGYDIATKSTQRMKGPLCHLDDCNFNHYQLQLSTYAYLLKKIKPELVIKRLVIYHIDHDGNESTHEVKYLEDEVRAMLKDFRKKLIKEKLDRDMRPIKY